MSLLYKRLLSFCFSFRLVFPEHSNCIISGYIFHRAYKSKIDFKFSRKHTLQQIKLSENVYLEKAIFIVMQHIQLIWWKRLFGNIPVYWYLKQVTYIKGFFLLLFIYDSLASYILEKRIRKTFLERENTFQAYIWNDA